MEYIDLKSQYSRYKEEIDKNVIECMTNANFILGKEVELFERNLAEYVGVNHSIGCGSGTDALHLIYMAYDIGRGDAIFCPDMTFIASIEPACLMGAVPVFCDINPSTFNISVESLERQICNVLNEGKLKPKAIVAVDFLGNPADYDELLFIAKKYNLLLIEDAAQATGSSYKGNMCGSLGDVSATSFFPSKPLGCYGDGGAVFTDDREILNTILSLRVHGKGKTKYDNIRLGLNSRLDTVQAAVLSIKLKYLSDEMKKRQMVAQRYREAFNNRFRMQEISCDNMSSYAQFVICTDNKKERDELKQYLSDNSIPSIVYYPNALHNLPVFRDIEIYGEKLENAVKYGECNLGLPFSPFLSTEDQDKVINVVLRYGGRR